MPASSATACSTPPAPARSSPRPRPTRCWRRPQAVDTGAGVLFIVKNYEGDVMNFEMAAEMSDGGHATVITNDDVAVENSTYTTGRRGVAGTLIVEKIVGAAAEAGHGLADAARRSATRVNARDPLDGRGADLAAPCPPPASRPSRSARTRWRWASASTASPAAGASSSQPADAIADEMMRRDPRRPRRRAPAARCCCSSTASAARRRWSST